MSAKMVEGYCKNADMRSNSRAALTSGTRDDTPNVEPPRLRGVILPTPFECGMSGCGPTPRVSAGMLLSCARAALYADLWPMRATATGVASQSFPRTPVADQSFVPGIGERTIRIHQGVEKGALERPANKLENIVKMENLAPHEINCLELVGDKRTFARIKSMSAPALLKIS